MQHATSLDLGGIAVIAIYFVALLGIGSVVKSGLRAWHNRNDEQDDHRQLDYFEHLQEREGWHE